MIPINDRVRDGLRELVSSHGASLAADPARLEALLAERFPTDHREANALVCAVRSGVAADQTAPLHLRVERLQRDWHLEEPLARWAVEAWEDALRPPGPETRSPRGGAMVRLSLRSEFGDTLEIECASLEELRAQLAALLGPDDAQSFLQDFFYAREEEE